MLKAFKIPKIFTEQFEESKGLEKYGFVDKPDDKIEDESSKLIEEADLQMISEQLNEAYKEDITIELLQKFSISHCLYKISYSYPEVEIKISYNSSEFNSYEIESKKGVSSQFEELLKSEINNTQSKITNKDFIYIVVACIHNTKIHDPNYGPDASDYIFQDAIKRSEFEWIKRRNEPKQQPFVPNPRGCGM